MLGVRLTLHLLLIAAALMGIGTVVAQSPYRILITNDDGADAPGIMALYRELVTLPNTEVMIVAPDRNYSGAGHWVNLRDPFLIEEVKLEDKIIGYKVNVPPASCVTIGARALMTPKPDLVVSGVNPGTNAGLVTPSSGTVAAAREAAMTGIPAIALSLDRPRSRGAFDYTRAVRYARQVVELVRSQGLPSGVFLNVNLPAQDIEPKGFLVTRQNLRDLGYVFVKQTNPLGRDLYWQTRDREPTAPEEGTDEWAVQQGYISVTPFTIDQTAPVSLPALNALKP